MSYSPVLNPHPVAQSGAWNINISNASIPVTGTFWQATQPVSGTITANAGTGTFAISAASLPLPTGAATAAKQPALGTAGVAATDVITVQGIASGVAQPVSGTFWQATQPVSIASMPSTPVTGTFWQATQPVSFTQQSLPANQSVNASQINGVTPLMGNGVTGTGSLRVTIASDNSAFSVNAAQSGTWNIGSITTLPALVAGSALIGKVGIDQTTVGTTNAVSLAQIGANTILTGNGVTGTGSQRVTIASDNTAFTVNAAQSGTWTVQPGNTANTTPWLAKLHDGTNAFTVKAASTASVAADTAVAVDVRPGGAHVTASAVLADALANPTLGRQAVLPSLYNGTTWDLQRGMGGNATTGDTGAKTATGNGATQTNIGNKGVQIVLNLGTVTGTTPTLVLKVQGSADGGTTWYDIPGATTASLTTGSTVFGITVYPGIAVTAGTTTTGSTATANMPLPRTWRVVWTIGGTTPSFTITNIQYNYLVN